MTESLGDRAQVRRDDSLHLAWRLVQEMLGKRTDPMRVTEQV